MQIRAIAKTNFGLRFSDKMNDVFNKGRQTVWANKSKDDLEDWKNIKKGIRGMFDRFYLLDADVFDNGESKISLTNTRQQQHRPKSVHVMTLPKDATLDLSKICNLYDKLANLNS